MLEESIDASPNRLNQSIRQKREHRKHKKKSLSSNSLISSKLSEENIKIFNSQLFYASFWNSENETENAQDSTENEQLKQQFSNNYERFKAEEMLAMADRNGQNQIPKRSHEQAPTQMFQTCEKLMESQKNVNTTVYLSFENEPKAEAGDCFNVQTECFLESFEVKEEQVQHVLDETLKPKPQNKTNNNFNEDDFDDDSTFLNENIAMTHISSAVSKKNKSIAEQILEDFCSSLSSSSSSDDDETKLIDFEPYFRFRKKRLRTYERCFRRPTATVANSAVIDAVVPPPPPSPPFENEDLQFSDTSSELSVQEANTQLIPILQPLELNYTSPMHNNLLNLSAFFTQNLLENVNCNSDLENKTWSSSSAAAAMITADDNDESEQSTHETEETGTETADDVPFNLFTEIQTLRLKFKDFSKQILCENSNDLLGFASTAEHAARLTQTKAGLSSIDQDPNTLNETLEAIPADDFEVESNPPAAPPPLVSCDAENSVFDDETWQHDSEFFINFKTQTILKSQKPPKTSPSLKKCKAVLKSDTVKVAELNADDDVQSINEEKKSEPFQNVIKFDFNDMVLSEWALEVCDDDDDAEVEAETVNIKVKEELPPVANNANVIEKNEFLAELFKEKEDFWTEPFTQLYQLEKSTENTKSIGQSIDEKSNETESIENKSQEPCTSKQASILYANRSASSTSSTTTATTAPFLGFSTASSKQIIVSDAARKKAEQIFAQLPELEFPKEKANSNCLANVKTLSHAIEKNTNEKCQFTGFQTASSKPINISDKAQKKYQNFFDEILKDEDCSNAKKEQVNSVSHFQVKASPVVPPSKILRQQSSSKFTGFQTASSKPINVSEKAQKRYQNFFDEILEENEDSNSRKEQVNSLSHFEDKALPVAPPSKSLKQQSSSNKKCKFAGFQTASSKPINICEKAQKKYQSFFDEILKENEEAPNKKIEHTKKPLETLIGEDFQDMQLSEWLPPENNSPKLAKIQPPPAKAVASLTPTKRKLCTLENTTTIEETEQQRPKKLCRSYTMSDITIGTPSPRKRCLRASSSDMPTTSSKSTANNSCEYKRNRSVIAKSNLLSLAKKRKLRLKQASKHYDDLNQVETPVKIVSTKTTAMMTTVENSPNVLEFNERLPNAAATSTPLERPNRRCLSALKSSENLDSDFKRINWEQFDEEKSNSLLSVSTPTRANNSTQNETLKSVPPPPPPSPQERIENLSFCGDPPPLPQMVTSSANRSRRLGLSRPRRRNLQQN